jgi:branched-chain amino acid transport system substrate-binding protein
LSGQWGCLQQAAQRHCPDLKQLFLNGERTMKTRSLWSLALVIASLGTFAHAQEKIVIGQSAPLTGPMADVGRDIRDGAAAVFKKVNDAGGINGRKIELVTLDDGNDRKRAGANAKSLIDENNAIVLFGFGSATLSLDAIPLAEAKGMALVAPQTGSLAIRDKKPVFTTRASYADEIDKIMAYWANYGATKMAVVHYDDEVGKKNFETVAGKLKTKPLQVSIKRNTKIDAAAFEPIFKFAPQVVIVTTQFGPVLDLFTVMQTKGKSYPVSALSFVNPDELASAPGGAARGTTVTQVVPSIKGGTVPVVTECRDAMKTAGYPALSYASLESCIAAKVLVEAMLRAGKNVNRQSLFNALENLGKVDVGGFTVAFSKDSHHGSSWTDLSILSRGGTFRH